MWVYWLLTWCAPQQNSQTLTMGFFPEMKCQLCPSFIPGSGCWSGSVLVESEGPGNFPSPGRWDAALPPPRGCRGHPRGLWLHVVRLRALAWKMRPAFTFFSLFPTPGFRREEAIFRSLFYPQGVRARTLPEEVMILGTWLHASQCCVGGRCWAKRGWADTPWTGRLGG